MKIRKNAVILRLMKEFTAAEYAEKSGYTKRYILLLCKDKNLKRLPDIERIETRYSPGGDYYVLIPKQQQTAI